MCKDGRSEPAGGLERKWVDEDVDRKGGAGPLGAAKVFRTGSVQSRAGAMEHWISSENVA